MEGFQERRVTQYAWLSVATAIATICLKTTAYLVTGSVGLLSDAIESLVNLSAAFLALYVLKVGDRPPDEDHAYGHNKAEYFSSGAEGGMILVAAGSIIAVAGQRLLDPQPITHVNFGIAVSIVASLLNLVVARVLFKAARANRSIALEADAHHLMTDVWTSVGVLAALGVVVFTGWNTLDPLIGIAVAVHIAWIGSGLMRRSIQGLMDVSIPETEVRIVERVLNRHLSENVQYHALRTRQAGARSFVSVHLQVPGAWTVQKGHDLAEKIESEIRQAVPLVTVFTHIEPREDPLSFADVYLDRPKDRE